MPVYSSSVLVRVRSGGGVHHDEPPKVLRGGISKVNFQETLSSFGDKCPKNGSKTAPTAPRPHLGYPHIGPFVDMPRMYGVRLSWTSLRWRDLFCLVLNLNCGRARRYPRLRRSTPLLRQSHLGRRHNLEREGEGGRKREREGGREREREGGRKREREGGRKRERERDTRASVAAPPPATASRPPSGFACPRDSSVSFTCFSVC